MKIELTIDNLHPTDVNYNLLDNIQTSLDTEFEAEVCDGILTDYPSISVSEVLDDWKTKCLYAVAELENNKKRINTLLVNKETEFTNKFMKSFINLVDELEIILEHEESEALRILYNKFLYVLAENDVTKISVKEGDTFNEELHEAVLINPTQDYLENNMIYKVICSGYKYKDTIIRYPKVIVSKINS